MQLKIVLPKNTKTLMQLGEKFGLHISALKTKITKMMLINISSPPNPLMLQQNNTEQVNTFTYLISLKLKTTEC